MRTTLVLAFLLVATAAWAEDPKPCAKGFIRLAPNFCFTENVTGTVISPWGDQVACGMAYWTGNVLPPEAKAVYVTIHWQFLAAGTAGPRQNYIRFYGDATCQNELTNSQAELREFVPVSPGTVIGRFKPDLIVPLCSSNTVCFTQANAGGFGNADILAMAVKGYYD